MRLKVVVNSEKPILDDFLWKNSQGNETLTNIKYDRLSDFCNGCGKLGHMAQSCKEEVKMSKTKMGHPMYGLWLIVVRPKKTQSKQMSGGT